MPFVSNPVCLQFCSVKVSSMNAVDYKLLRNSIIDFLSLSLLVSGSQKANGRAIITEKQKITQWIQRGNKLHARITISYRITSFFYVNTNTADAIHLGSLEVFYFFLTHIPRCLVVESIELNTVVMTHSTKVAAYGADHRTGVDGGTFAPVRPRFAAAASADT